MLACAGVQGVPEGEVRVTCTACAGTLLLELGLLSRLTGNPVYERSALHAAKQVFGALQLPSTVVHQGAAEQIDHMFD